jgi:hypothetical protein
MKASKVIELLAKQIADRGDQETYFITEISAGLPDSEHDVEFEIKSITVDATGDFSIYGEMV